MAEYVRIGFIGCGGNASGHMRRLNNMQDVKVVAVCDLKEEIAASAAERCDAGSKNGEAAIQIGGEDSRP